MYILCNLTLHNGDGRLNELTSLEQASCLREGAAKSCPFSDLLLSSFFSFPPPILPIPSLKSASYSPSSTTPILPFFRPQISSSHPFFGGEDISETPQPPSSPLRNGQILSPPLNTIPPLILFFLEGKKIPSSSLYSPPFPSPPNPPPPATSYP